MGAQIERDLHEVPSESMVAVIGPRLYQHVYDAPHGVERSLVDSFVTIYGTSNELEYHEAGIETREELSDAIAEVVERAEPKLHS